MPGPKTKMTAIILAGGNSIRMGENKAFLQIQGVPIIIRICTLLRHLFEEIIIVTNQKDLFNDFDSKIYTDLIPNKGALGGLYTGIFFSTFQYSFCVACDMPFLNGNLVQFLIKNINGEDAIVPRTADGLQPLHAIYSKSCLGPMKDVIAKGKRRVTDFGYGFSDFDCSQAGALLERTPPDTGDGIWNYYIGQCGARLERATANNHDTVWDHIWSGCGRRISD